jgi:hypothetical protein
MFSFVLKQMKNESSMKRGSKKMKKKTRERHQTNPPARTRADTRLRE